MSVKLYGRYSLKDSTGRAITGFSWMQPSRSGSYIRTGDGVFDTTGTLRLREVWQGMYLQHGGWYTVRGYYPQDKYRVLRDDLRYPFKDSFVRVDFVGRYLLGFRDYSGLPKVYDRYTRRFVDQLVESALPGDAYVVFDPASRRRSIIRNGQSLRKPWFSAALIPNTSGMIVLRQDTTERRGFQERTDAYRSREWEENPPAPPKYAVLDSDMREILPMRYNSVELLSQHLIAAQHKADSSLELFDRAGRLLGRAKVPGTSLKRSGAIVYLSSDAETLIFDTTGRLLFRDALPPELLYANKPEPGLANEYRPFSPLPSVIMKEERPGAWSVNDLNGRRLQPQTYRPLPPQVPGLFRVKRGDSVYVLNHAGRLLYGGRGFSGKNYLLLDNYSALLQGPSGAWGMIDVDGKAVLPFAYDSVWAFNLNAEQAPLHYVLRREGRYSWMDNAGRMLSQDADWLPLQCEFGEYFKGSDKHLYFLKDGRAVRFREGMPESELAPVRFGTVYFRTLSCCGRTEPEIYTHRLRRVGPYHAQYSWPFLQDKAIVYDSARRLLSVVDSGGNVVMPPAPRPARLIWGLYGVLTLDSAGRTTLYHRTSGLWTKLELIPDTGYMSSLREHGAVSQGFQPFFFTSPDGRSAGMVNHFGEVSQLPAGTSLQRRAQGAYFIKGPTGWGLLGHTLEERVPPVFDSIRSNGEDYEASFVLFKNGLQGGYAPSFPDKYIPARYDRVEEFDRGRSGYILATRNDSLYLVDRNGTELTQGFDDVDLKTLNQAAITVTLRGLQRILSLESDGMFRLRRRLPGEPLPEGYRAIDIVWTGDKAGLRNLETDSVILPAEYDFIALRESGLFVAWKYKSDKHEGVDSTLVLDADGALLLAMGGGHSPQLQGKGRVAPLTEKAAQEIDAGQYSLESVLERGLLIVSRVGVYGLLDGNGAWLHEPAFSGIDYSGFGKTGLLVAEVQTPVYGSTGGRKYMLIDAKGKKLTDAIYYEIRIDEKGVIRFDREGKEGILSPSGKEAP